MSCDFTYVDETFPELTKNFKDQSKIHVTKYCKDLVKIICPCCKREYETRVVDYIRSGKVPCLICNDGFPYTEKFMGNILKELNIQYIYQFSPKWAKPYRYDFMFKYNNISYIIEMDGGLGHGYHDSFDKSADECLKIDKFKDRLALEYGYIVIRVDCNYENKNRYTYIKNNIYSSLHEILSLDYLNWDYCHQKSLKSKFHEAIDLYQNGVTCLEDISNLTDIKLRTVVKYITEAMNCDIIPKCRLDIKKNKEKNRRPITNPLIIRPDQATNRAVYCYEDALLFRSLTDAALYYGFMRNSLYAAMREFKGYCKGRHFIMYNDLPSDFDFKRIIFPNKQYIERKSKQILCQYNLDNKLMKIYVRKEELPSGMAWGNIWRCCVNIRDSAYGYKWKFLDKQDEFEIFEMIRANEMARFYFAN